MSNDWRYYYYEKEKMDEIIKEADILVNAIPYVKKICWKDSSYKIWR